MRTDLFILALQIAFCFAFSFVVETTVSLAFLRGWAAKSVFFLSLVRVRPITLPVDGSWIRLPSVTYCSPRQRCKRCILFQVMSLIRPARGETDTLM